LSDVIDNPSFESPAIPSGNTYLQDVPSFWTVTPASSSYVFLSGASSRGGTYASAGTQYVAVRDSGTTLSQNVTLVVGQMYQLTFCASATTSSGYYGGVYVPFTVRIGGTTVYYESEPSITTTMKCYSLLYTSPRVNSNVTFTNNYVGSNTARTIFFDQVYLVPYFSSSPTDLPSKIPSAGNSLILLQKVIISD